METIVAGRTAILRQEGKLVIGWVEELGLQRYGESVAEVVQGLERDAARVGARRVSAVVAARLGERFRTTAARQSHLNP